MKLCDIAQQLGLRCLTPQLHDQQQVEVTHGHASDLLSDVLANAPHGAIAVTLQVHLNVVAVAAHAGLAGVILTAGHDPDEQVIRRAVEEGIPLYGAADNTFEVVGRLYAMGLRGGRA